MTARRKEMRAGYLFALPWLFGFGLFMVYPLAASIYYSFCEYSVLKAPIFVGMENYRDIVHDTKFWVALWNTVFYTVLSVPIATVVSIALAIMLNAKVKGQAFYRTAFYLPSLVPQVALAIIWMQLLNEEHGVINNLLDATPNHLPKAFQIHPGWMTDPAWTKPSLIFMSVWTGGNAMVIYLAGLQEVPSELIEASDLDGASPWSKLRHVTLPMISPVILFNVVMAMIGAFQNFVVPYIMFPAGAPNLSTYFYVSYLFDNAMVYHKMGYACAMGWIMFLIIFFMTLACLKISEKRVYYGGG